MSKIFIEWNGRRRRVTKKMLLDYAARGLIGPDTRIWHAGRESVCGRVYGIDFPPGTPGWINLASLSVEQIPVPPPLVGSDSLDNDATNVNRADSYDFRFEDEQSGSFMKIVILILFLLLIFCGLVLSVFLCVKHIKGRGVGTETVRYMYPLKNETTSPEP